ncbi:MAG: AAA family ATPase [Peptococcaceae bacterium]|jgi:hypothetical protein|nr:AAA family ATPase [Peptococcaceae bacterium]
MNIITGEELGYLKVPERPRRQFHGLMKYLREQSPVSQSVCTLYGLRRTGKTTLILQAIQELIGQGVHPETVGYFSGQKGDAFDDLIIETEARKKLKYIFIDEIGFYANFLKNGNYLYDTLVRLYDKKVVIAGTNLLALYLAGKGTLYDRSGILRVPYLSFYEHCAFVPDAEPTRKDFTQYLQNGGLFQPPADIADYVQSSITNSITELFETEPESDIFPWLKPESEDVDWKGYVNTVLLLSSNYVSNRSFQVPPSIREDIEAIDADVTRKALRDFRQYFSLSPRDRGFRMKRTETVALLDFLTHCGVITVLPNLFDDTEPYRCYVQTPFLRFHFTDKLQSLTGGASIHENTPLFGNLLEAAVVSEYRSAHPGAKTCFARTHHPRGSDEVFEIDLLDMDAKRGYEIKLTESRGYKGFEKLGARPELKGFQFEILSGAACVEQIYQWGREAYQELENTQHFSDPELRME